MDKNFWNVGAVVAIVAIIGMAAVSITNENVKVEIREQTSQISQTPTNLGSALYYSTAQGSKELYDLLSGVITDIGLSSSTTWDPASISTSTLGYGLPNTSTTLTIPGASIGDLVIAELTSVTSTAKWFVTGRVTAANTVTVNLYNADTAALDLDSTTVKVRVFPYTISTTATSTP